MRGIHRLKGVIKHYEWGGTSFLPALLQQHNSPRLPFAEYWMGVHRLGQSVVEANNREWKPLSELTGPLPFLLKILDVNKMLSIQVHPSKDGAVAGFEKENAAAIPLDSAKRNYKDDNHKPELVVALGDFWLLHGFKPPEEMLYTLINVVELRELLPVFNQSGYKGLYKHVMEMPQDDVNRILQPLIDNIGEIYKDARPGREDEDYWADKAAKEFCSDGKIDRGLFSIYLFNLVHLEKGEAIFQEAGVPHAYLEGVCVEIMANSDNVLRGGLTNKHIDVRELLKHTRCEATHVTIIEAEDLSPHEKMYNTTANDFRLSVFEMSDDTKTGFKVPGPAIFVITEGAATISNESTTLSLEPGLPSALVLPDGVFQLHAIANSLIFCATAADSSR